MDLQKLITGLYDPLLRYHQKKSTFAADIVAGKDAAKLGDEISGSKHVKAFLDNLGDIKGDTTQLSDTFIAKWKNDEKFFIKNLEKDLAKNPKLAEQLNAAIKTNPNQVAVNLAKYEAGGLAALIPTVVAEPTKPTPPPQEDNSTKKNTAAPTTPKAAPAAVPATGTNPSVAPVTTAKPASEPTPPPPEVKLTDKQIKVGKQIARDLFEKLADKSDEEIVNRLDKDVVASILENLSAEAIEKFGVSKGEASGFSERIKDPELLHAITENFKRNPGFVRELAKASKESSDEPLSESKKNAARAFMKPILAKAEMLADDATLKQLESNLKLGNSKNPIMDMFAGLFGGSGGLGALFSGFVDKIKDFFAGFFGDKQVFSLRNTPGSMFPTVMVDQRARQFNERQNDIDRKLSNPRDMTAFITGNPPGYMIDEKEGPDGKVAQTKVWNGINIRTADAETMKVHPSVSTSLQAVQEADGSYRVPVVVKLNDLGKAENIRYVMMAKKDFDAYKNQVDSIAEAAGDNRSLKVSHYPAEQLAAEKRYASNITTIHPETGAVIAPSETPSAIAGVIPPKGPSANDPQYKKEA